MQIPESKVQPKEQTDADYKCSGPELGDLPESCIAAILALTTPRDVARLSCTSRVFLHAARADLVWEAMLPPHYTDILADASDAPPSTCSKREVYDYLVHRMFLQSLDQIWTLQRCCF